MFEPLPLPWELSPGAEPPLEGSSHLEDLSVKWLWRERGETAPVSIESSLKNDRKIELPICFFVLSVGVVGFVSIGGGRGRGGGDRLGSGMVIG